MWKKIIIIIEGALMCPFDVRNLNSRDTISKIKKNPETTTDYSRYIPIKNSCDVVRSLVYRGAKITYMTRLSNKNEIESMINSLQNFDFPEQKILSGGDAKSLCHMIEQSDCNVLIECDYKFSKLKSDNLHGNLSSDRQKKIKSVVIREYSGIDAFIKAKSIISEI